MSNAMNPLRQPPASTYADAAWDAVVVGAGPAGAMTALHLAQRNRRVLLIDREHFPRDKVCGDGLIPDSLHCLKRAGVLEPVRQSAFALDALEVYSPSRNAVTLPGTFLTIKRLHLDHILVSAAVERGATLCQGRVKSVAPIDGQGVRIHLHDQPAITARVAALATGADVALLEQLDLVDQLRASATALRCYIRSDVALDRLVISFDRSILPGYAWIFPLRDGEFNVGCGVFHDGRPMPDVNLRDMFDTFMSSFPLCNDLFAKGVQRSPLRGARLRCGLHGAKPIKHDRVLAVGETIGTTFPFTGEGIGKAMEAGELAASVMDEALQDGHFERIRAYSDLLETRLRPKYLGYQAAEKWLSSAFINDFMIGRARKSRYLRQLAAGIIDETADPREMFSVKGILKSLWR